MKKALVETKAFINPNPI